MRVVHSRQSNALPRACPAAPRFCVAPVTLSLWWARDADRGQEGRKAKEGEARAHRHSKGQGTGRGGREVAGSKATWSKGRVVEVSAAAKAWGVVRFVVLYRSVGV